jgi:hypothetical protein
VEEIKHGMSDESQAKSVIDTSTRPEAPKKLSMLSQPSEYYLFKGNKF